MTTLKDISILPGYETELEYVRSIGCHSLTFFGGEVREGGYHVQQNPYEFAALLTWLKHIEHLNPIPGSHDLYDPYSYLEVGSASGGFIRAIHERVPFGSAIMIDNGAYMEEHQLDNISAFKDKVSRHILDSHSPQAKAVLADKKFDVIFVDGDHSYEGVKLDIDMVLPHAHPATFIIFHDIQCSHVPGVQKAYEEALAEGKIREVARFVKENKEPDGLTFGIGITQKV